MNENCFQVLVTASKTFPEGIIITQLGDNTDPLNHEMSIECDETLEPMTLSVISGTEDDKNLQKLFDVNLDGSLISGWDDITATVFYSEKEDITLTDGIITGCALLGDLKIYRFVFAPPLSPRHPYKK